MSCDDSHCISGICLLCREKETGHLQGALDTAVRGKERKKRRERSRCLPETCALPNPTPPSTQSFTRDRENELEFRLQHIRLPLMRLDQGRSAGGFRAEGRLWCLYGGRATSGQGCPMVGLHLVDQCLVCGRPFPAADKQEDTSANSSSSKEREKKESGGTNNMSEHLLVVGLCKMLHLLQCRALFLFKMTSNLVSQTI